jgi:IPT/TIG domain
VTAAIAASALTAALAAPAQAVAGEPPTITAVEPASGREAGGQSVRIKGTHLSGAIAVRFGSSNAEQFSVESEGSIEAVTPPGTGTVDVTVTSAGGTSTTSSADRFTYVPGPVVTGIEPREGGTGRGTVVKISGEHFTHVGHVYFGAFHNATTFTINSDSSITAVSPSGTRVVDVRVSSPGGESEKRSSDRFAYVQPSEVAEYRNWMFSGTITDGRRDTQITLPEGSMFNGSGELDNETGSGTISGTLPIPPFSAPALRRATKRCRARRR